MKKSKILIVGLIALLMAGGLVLAGCEKECTSMGNCNYTYKSATNVGISDGNLCNIGACKARTAYNNKAKYTAYCDCN